MHKDPRIRGDPFLAASPCGIYFPWPCESSGTDRQRSCGIEMVSWRLLTCARLYFVLRRLVGIPAPGAAPLISTDASSRGAAGGDSDRRRATPRGYVFSGQGCVFLGQRVRIIRAPITPQALLSVVSPRGKHAPRHSMLNARCGVKTLRRLRAAVETEANTPARGARAIPGGQLPGRKPIPPRFSAGVVPRIKSRVIEVGDRWPDRFARSAPGPSWPWRSGFHPARVSQAGGGH